jgi:hypothetical protein
MTLSCASALIRALEPAGNIGYGQQKLPSARDMEVETLLREAIAAGAIPDALRGATDQQRAVLRVFAERISSLAVRARSEEKVILALAVLCLSASRSDARELAAILPLPLHAARVVGLDINEAVKRVRGIVGDALAEPLLDFLKRAPEDRSLEAMGYVAGADEGGFRYMRLW